MISHNQGRHLNVIVGCIPDFRCFFRFNDCRLYNRSSAGDIVEIVMYEFFSFCHVEIADNSQYRIVGYIKCIVEVDEILIGCITDVFFFSQYIVIVGMNGVCFFQGFRQ